MAETADGLSLAAGVEDNGVVVGTEKHDFARTLGSRLLDEPVRGFIANQHGRTDQTCKQADRHEGVRRERSRCRKLDRYENRRSLAS